MNDTSSDDKATTTTGVDDGWDWALVEIMGHRTHWGRIREEERFGAKMLRVDVPSIDRQPNPDGGEPVNVVTWSTHYYGGSAIFSFSLTDEATVMKRNAPYRAPHRLIYQPSPEEYFTPEGDDLEAEHTEAAEE